MGKGITETLNWFYNLVLFYACGRLYALRLYNSLCFYTTGRFYASTMLLYADCQFCFTPLYDSTHLRCYCTPNVSFVLYHCTFLRIYISMAHFAFTPLYDSPHLRCYCTPTVSFVLHHCTILRIYDATVRRLAVFFIPLYVPTHLRFCGSLYIVTAYWTETQGKTDTA